MAKAADMHRSAPWTPSCTGRGGLDTSIDQYRSERPALESGALADPSRHTASPETVGNSVVAWFSGATLNLSGPAVFGVTLVGAFALGLILVTIGLALLPAAR